MKQIQWFPGHMFKSLREIKEKLKLMDLVIVLLDARLPFSSLNPELKRITQHKPTLILFNKMDLSDQKVLSTWMKYYQDEGYYVLKIDAQTGQNIQKIRETSEIILREKLEREKAKGLKRRALRTIILGIPNVGKSTLINRLSQSSATKTGNRPGVTKAQQWIKLGDDFELLDTPGVLWPKFDDPKVGYHLAVTGAIKDNILPEDDVVNYAVSFLKTYYPERLRNRYDVDPTLSFVEILDHIGQSRGALLKGAEIDYERVYQIILTDIRNNQLGGLSFDRIEHVSV